jgi:hypothetical protein
MVTRKKPELQVGTAGPQLEGLKVSMEKGLSGKHRKEETTQKKKEEDIDVILELHPISKIVCRRSLIRPS